MIKKYSFKECKWLEKNALFIFQQNIFISDYL